MKERKMLVVRAMVGATLVAGAATMLSFDAAPAGATVCDPPINGTFTATSDGQWAQTRDVYHDEATVTSTWNVSTSCTDAMDCTGRVTSSQGWSAPTRCDDGLWFVKRQVDNWEPCWDGTAAPGQQTYAFNPDITDPANFVGWDKTVGPSGACGKNQWLTINMPFKLTTSG
jgi:hypothetical protein